MAEQPVTPFLPYYVHRNNMLKKKSRKIKTKVVSSYFYGAQFKKLFLYKHLYLKKNEKTIHIKVFVDYLLNLRKRCVTLRKHCKMKDWNRRREQSF